MNFQLERFRQLPDSFVVDSLNFRFLNDRISEHKDPRFIGQTASEYSQGITDFPPLMNDDRILVYYLQIKAQRNPHYRVVCVTNDVNLQTRGAVNNIDIISGAKLFDEVGKRMRGEVSMFDEPVGSRIVEPPVTMLNFPSSVCLQLQNCIKIILIKLLSTLVESRMKEVNIIFVSVFSVPQTVSTRNFTVTKNSCQADKGKF